jgi:hypothetical protein
LILNQAGRRLLRNGANVNKALWPVVLERINRLQAKPISEDRATAMYSFLKQNPRCFLGSTDSISMYTRDRMVEAKIILRENLTYNPVGSTCNTRYLVEGEILMKIQPSDELEGGTPLLLSLNDPKGNIQDTPYQCMRDCQEMSIASIWQRLVSNTCMP